MAIITISRGSMSGGEALATCLGTVLDHPVVGRNVLVAAAEKLGVPEETLTQKIERGPAFWERMTSNRRLYVIAVEAALAERAAAGELVYHGHAGHLLLRSLPNVLRVRLIAPFEARVRATIERQHLSRAAAEEYVRQVDEERVRWTKFIYGVDWSDPGLYDLVINLERMGVDTACAMVAAAAERPEFVATPASRRALDDLRLACRVRLALAGQPRTQSLTFEVRAADGVVTIAGELPRGSMFTHSAEQDEAQVLETARAVEGVRAVELQLRRFDAYH